MSQPIGGGGTENTVNFQTRLKKGAVKTGKVAKAFGRGVGCFFCKPLYRFRLTAFLEESQLLLIQKTKEKAAAGLLNQTGPPQTSGQPPLSHIPCQSSTRSSPNQEPRHPGNRPSSPGSATRTDLSADISNRWSDDPATHAGRL